jgi:hypothetical protein
MTTWETIEVPRGAYIGWGSKKGQHVTGKVLDYQPEGGTDFNGNACPSATIELTEAAASFNKDGDRSDFAAGELIQLNAGQVSLKRALRAADPAAGDLVKITLVNLAKTDKGTVKEFDIKIARGAGGGAPKAEPKAKAAEVDDDEPPL